MEEVLELGYGFRWEEVGSSARFEHAVYIFDLGEVSSKVLIHGTAAGDPVRWSPDLAELHGCVFLASPGCTLINRELISYTILWS